MATSNPFRIETDISLKPSQADLNKLKKEIEAALNSSSADRFDKSVASVATKLKQAYIQADKLDQQMEKIRSGSIKTEGVKELEAALKNEKLELKDIEKQYEKTNAATAEGMELAKTAAAIRQEIERINRLIVQYYDTEVDKSPEMQATANSADLLNDKVQMLIHEFEKLQGKSSEAADAMTEATKGPPEGYVGRPWESMDPVVQDLIRMEYKLADATNKVFSLIGRGVKKVIGFYKKLGAAVLQVTKNMAKMAAQKLSQKIFHRKSVDDYEKGLKKSLKTLLKYGLGVRSLFFLFRKIRAAFKEGIKSLVQYDGELNASVSQLTSAFKQLKYSLATAFAPIVTVVAPYITYLIKLMNKALDGIGMFMSALTGKSTYTKVAEIQEDYAQSLLDTADNTKKAKKEAKDYLSPLDEINRLESNKTDENSDSSNNNGMAVNYETVPIDAKFKDVADRLKSYIKNEDWEGLGAYAAAGINKGLERIYKTISWDNVGPKVTYFVNAFTTTFNSLVDNIDWDLLGRTIGTGVNTIVKTLNLLYEGIDWENIGASIAEGFHGMIDEINFDELGNLIGNKIMVLPKILYGAVVKMEKQKTFKLAGVKFGDLVNGIFEKIDLGKIGTTIGKAFTGIGDFLLNAASTIDWKAIGANIANGINKFFSNFNVTKFMMGVMKFIDGIYVALLEAIQKTNWEGVVTKLFQFISQAFLLVLKTGALIINLGWELIKGLVQGIIDAIKGINWDTIWGKIIEWFKNFFKIGSPSKVFMDFGKDLIQGLIDGIKALIGKVVEKFQNLKENLAKKWEGIKSSAKTKWESIRSTIKSKVADTVSNTKTRWSTLKSNLSTIWGNIKTNSSTSFKNIKKGILDTWESVKTGTKNIWDKIKNIIKKPINAIISFINAMLRGVISGINGIGGVLNNLHIDIPDWVPKFGGGVLGFNIPTFNAPQIPLLAQGAVIPPNKEFMAILGDQKQGTNIETPESLLRRIIREEAGSGNDTYKIELTVSGRTILQAVLSEAQMKKRRSGSNPFELA